MANQLAMQNLNLQKERKAAVERLAADLTTENLWAAMAEFEAYPFQTAKGLEFTYRIKGNEMFVDRKDKSITRATVNVAFQKALELRRVVTGPKKLGCFGASYLYPVFIQIGVIVTTES